MDRASYCKREHSASTGSWVVRDDRAGTLTAALTTEIDAAHRLLESAGLIRDNASFEHWQDQFWVWRTRCGAKLQRGFEREAAAEFYGGTVVRSFPKERWREARRAAVKAVEDMIQLLVTLRATLQGRGVSPVRAREDAPTAVEQASGPVFPF